MVNCLLWDRWMDGSNLPALSTLDSAVRREDAWGRICKMLTKLFRGHHESMYLFPAKRGTGSVFFLRSAAQRMFWI